MTKPLDLVSARAKLARGQGHAAELLREVRAWLNDESDPPIRPGFNHEPDKRRTLADVKSLKKIPPEWDDFLGDALHNYRSALNHVVGAMVRVGSDPQKFTDLRSYFQFPVFEGSRSDFLSKTGNARRSQLPGVRRKHVEAISPFQPYKSRGNRWALRALKDLNDLDKHRKPVLAIHYVAGMFHVQPVPPIVRHKSAMADRAVEPGAHLQYLNWLTDTQPIVIPAHPWTSSDNPDMTVRFGAAATVVLEDLTPVRLLTTCLDEIEGLVEEVIRKVGAL